jgi:hypothetical protein
MNDEARMIGGPLDGVELDLEELFGGRRHGALVIPLEGRFAQYDLDEDELGRACYRFSGWEGGGWGRAGRERGRSTSCVARARLPESERR